jgi:PAS domain S-box-containing protein
MESERPRTRAAQADSRRLGRLLLGSLLLATVATAAATLWYYARQRDALEHATILQLRANAASVSDQLHNWRAERLGDGTVLATGVLRRLTTRALTSEPSEEDRRDLLALFRNLEHSFLYSGAALIDAQGRTHFEFDGGIHAPRSLWMDVASNVPDGQAGLSNFYRHPQSDHVLMAVVIPVDGNGVVILEIDASRFLYPYLAARTSSSRTGETILVRTDGLLLSALRYSAGAELTQYAAKDVTELQQAADDPDGGVTHWNDYRDVPVLCVVRRVTDSPWYVVTKIDQEEVFAPLRALAWKIGSAFTLIALANAGAVGWIWRSRQLRGHREREEWFRAIANDTPAYLWMADRSTGNSFINAPLREFLGADREALDVSWVDYVHPDDRDRAAEVYAAAAEAGGPYRDELRIRRFDGEYRWFMSDAQPRFSADGQFAGYAGALVDVTERRQAEQALRKVNVDLAHELDERRRTEDQVHALSGRLIHAQEQERSRLARELHDDVGQQLAAVSIAISNLKRAITTDSADARVQADRIQRKLTEVADGMRRISHELHPAALTHLGLADALRAHASEFARLTGVDVDVVCDGPTGDLQPPVVLSLYRIAQEALQNVAKHSGANAATIRLSRTHTTVRLTIADAGRGMDSDVHSRGLGLVSIAERVRLLDGRYAIQSGPGTGTTVTVEVPAPALS